MKSPRITPRKRQVLALLLEGLRQGQIARELSVGVETVRTHRREIYQFFGVHSRAELAALFARPSEAP
jgi:two-component system secretion response regulator SsrB